MPGYATVPLQQEAINVAACQMMSVNTDPANPEAGKSANLEHMLEFCDLASGFGGPKQLVVFPEFGLTGYNTFWTREEWLRIAIHVPGPEIDRLAKRAKELNCHIAFQAHTQEKDWPGHFIPCSLLISPTDGLIHTHWKAYKDFPGMGLEYGTTTHAVLDKFVKKYGYEKVWPVARTPIGNIGTYVCSEGFAPETARALAFNGAEVLCRSIAGGGRSLGAGKMGLQFRADCAASSCWGIYANRCTIRGVGSMGGGSSMIVDPNGQVVAEAIDAGEQIVAGTIPISAHRKTHFVPNIPTEIYQIVLEQHPGQFPPNLYADCLPKDYDDAHAWSLKHKRDDRPMNFTPVDRGEWDAIRKKAG